MAVTAVTTTMAGAINYTVVTDTSADWASVANSTYFYDKADKLVHYKDSTGTILEIFTSSTGGSTTSAGSLILDVKINQTGGILKGQAVYVNGADGTNIEVGKADYSTEMTSSKTLGLLISSGADNDQRQVITEGDLKGTGGEPLDTSAGAQGDPVWLGDDGNLIYGLVNKPYAPNHLVFIGVVVQSHPVVGEIYVKVQNGFELDEIHNVDLKSVLPIDGDVLTFNASTGLWEPRASAVSSGGNYLISGGSSWSGTGMVFNVTDLVYQIDGVEYSVAGINITLAAGDPSNARFDAIVVNEAGVISVITGTPSANPLAPAIPGDSVLVQYVLVATGATTPTITNEFVYRDTLTADWTPGVVPGTAPTMTAIFNSTTPPPFIGPQCTLVNAPSYTTSKYLRYVKPSGNISRTSFPFLSFRVYLPVSLTGTRNLIVRLYNGATYINAIYASPYGYNSTSTGSWQLVVIPLTAFGNTAITTVTEVRFYLSGVALNTSSPGYDQFALDDVKFQSGYGSQSNIATIEVQDTGSTVSNTAKLNFVNGQASTAVITNDIPNSRVNIQIDSDNIYNADGILTAPRTIDGNLKGIEWQNLDYHIISVVGSTPLQTDLVNYLINPSALIPGGRIFTITDAIASKRRFAILNTGKVQINEEYTLPDIDGSAFQALTTDGAGNLYWSEAITPSSAFIPPVEQSEIRRGVLAISNSTAQSVLGGITINTTGSIVAQAYGGSVPLPKYRVLTTAASTNSVVGVVYSSFGVVHKIGRGFRFIGSYIYSDQSSGGTNWYVPGARQFCGMTTGSSLLPLSDINTLESRTNIIGIGSDAADVNLQIFHNDASGTATKIDLGPNFPANKTGAVLNQEVYQLELYNIFGTTTVKYRVRRLSDGLEITGTISSNLPSGAIDLGCQVVRTSGSTSQNVSIDVIQLTAYTRE